MAKLEMDLAITVRLRKCTAVGAFGLFIAPYLLQHFPILNVYVGPRGIELQRSGIKLRGPGIIPGVAVPVRAANQSCGSTLGAE
jgi:hypothetical protein